MTRFDELFELGRAAVLDRIHECDKPPGDGGRWGMAVILRPTPQLTTRLGELTGEAMRVAGGHHWPTGSPPAVHFTVRALEPYRDEVPDDDAAVMRYRSAVDRAAKRCRPVALTVRGLTLTPSCVMACATTDDGTAAEFASVLGAELGPDGWFEADFDRTIWYSTIVHFTGPIDDPRSLVDWVGRRRETLIGQAVLDTAELVRYRFNGRHTQMLTISSSRLV